MKCILLNQGSIDILPILVLGFAWMGSFILPLFLSIVSVVQVAFVLHGLFSLIGVMVGSVGIMGREFMNRRAISPVLLALIFLSVGNPLHVRQRPSSFRRPCIYWTWR